MLAIVLPVFVLIGLGYALRRVGMLDSEDSYKLVGLIMNVTYPATLFVALVKAPLPTSAWKMPFWSVATIGASMLLTFAFSRLARLDRPTTGALIVASAFGNTGFLGVPFNYWLYGGEGRVLAAVYDLVGVSIPLYGIGFTMLEAYGGRKFELSAFLNFFKAPAFWGAVAGAVTRALIPWWHAHVGNAWMVAGITMQTLQLLAPLTAPLAMIALGVNFRIRAVAEFLPTVSVSCLAKVVLMPLTAFVLVRYLGPHGTAGRVTVLEAAMPGGIVAGALCGRYGCNARLGAAITVGTTLAALVTLPLWAAILGQ